MRSLQQSSATVCTLLALVGFSFLLGLARAADPVGAETILRQPAKPAWELDVTDSLECVSIEGAASIDQAMAAPSVPFAKEIDRESQMRHVPVPDALKWWKGQITLPQGQSATQPLVLEFDDHRVVQGLWFNGEPVKVEPVSSGRNWSSGEGAFLLPAGPDFSSGTIAFRAARLTQIYPNGFGRVRVRPATLEEYLSLRKPSKAGGSAVLKNTSHFPVHLTALVEIQDHFGVRLASKESDIQLNAGGSSVIPAPEWAAGSDVWKARYSLREQTGPALEYWAFFAPNRENWERPEVLCLADGWEYKVVSGPHEPTPPTEGWKKPPLPHELPDSEWTSHWMWYRARITVPAAWTGKTIHLWLPHVREHAKVYANGKLVADKFSWQLPDTIPLEAQAGETIDLSIAVTDYIVGLSEGVPIPSGGKKELPLRGLSAPISTFSPGLVMVPELLGLPPIHTATATLRTKIGGGCTVSGDLEIKNSTGKSAKLRVATILLDQGVEMSRAMSEAFEVPPASQKTCPLPSPDASLARSWNLDTPKLYELRVEIQSDSGEVLDSSRHRVGFREIGVSGDHFTVNGERVNLNGGSHVLITPSVTWPVRNFPYRIHRFYYPGPPSIFKGRFMASMGDDLGFFVKAEVPGHDALHQSKYNFQNPAIWERTFERTVATIREIGNHPSVAIWDVGNELWFGIEGEDQKMADLYKRIEAVDPTRPVVNGGGYPNWVPGAAVQDWHGWPNYDTRRDWFFYHPEDRPDYQRNAGVFIRSVDGESGWTLHTQGKVPPEPKNLISLGNAPILFSEGHYYENGFRDDVGGASARVPLPSTAKLKGFDQELGLHALNWLACRKITITNARVAGFPSSMIHVDRGVGRWVQPLAMLPLDRKSRFLSGGTLDSRFVILNDLTVPVTVRGECTVWLGGQRVGSQAIQANLEAGAHDIVTLNVPLPETLRNESLRLSLRIWDENSKAFFRDDLDISLFASGKTSAPGGIRLFDAEGLTEPLLKARGIPFEKLASLGDWTPDSEGFLLVGSDSLSKCSATELAELAKKINGGGKAVILDHADYPVFLKTKLVSKPYLTATMKVQSPTSPVLSGLVPSDLLFWQTTQRDWISSRASLEAPSSGMFEVIASTAKGASLLEIREGLGRVLFASLNFSQAGQMDPAAGQLLENLLQWGREVRVEEFPATLIVSTDPKWLRGLQSRLGLEGRVDPAPSDDDIEKTELLVLAGTDAAALDALTREKESVQEFLEKGGVLFVQDANETTAEWLSSLSGKSIRTVSHKMDRAFPLRPTDLLRGLDNSSFFWTQSTRSQDLSSQG